MTAGDLVGLLLDELEQEFPALAKERPVRLRLQASQALACQQLSRIAEAKGLLLVMLDHMLASMQEGELHLHVHCQRHGIAFDFSAHLPHIPGTLEELMAELGARLSPWQGGLRLEFPREFTPLGSRTSPSVLSQEFACLHGHRILLIEDDAFHRQSLALSLMRAGLHVDSCHHKDAGLEIAVNSHQLSALVVHIPHPLCAGIGILHRLRDAGITQPLIALTTAPEPGDHALCLSSGGTALLSKQTSARALLEALNQALQYRSAPAQDSLSTEL